MAEEVVKRIRIQVDGDQAKKELEDVKSSLKETNSSVKNLEKTNLGNFSQSLGSLKDQFLAGEIGAKGLAKGVLTVGKAMFTAFVTNPVGIIIAAIAGAMLILYNVFKDFKPLVDAIQRSFAAVSAIFSVLKNSISSLITGSTSLKDTFKGLGGAMSDAAKEAKALVDATNDLEDAQEAQEVSNAKAKTKIDELMLQSKNRTISEKERIALIDQAMKIEKEQNDATMKNAEEAERIAFRKIVNSKRLSDEQIQMIKDEGVAGLRKLQDLKQISDEEVENYKNTLIAKEQLLQGNIAFNEKAQNRIDAANEKSKTDAEAAQAKRKEAEDKAFEEYVKQAEERQAVANSLMTSQDTADTNRINRSKLLEKFNAEREKDEIKRAEMLLEISTKQYEEDKTRKEDEISQWKDGTAEKIALTDQLRQIETDYFTNKVLQEENIAKLSIDKAKEVADKKKESLLKEFDDKIVALKQEEDLLATLNINQLEHRKDYIKKESDLIQESYDNKLISEKEYQSRVNALIVETQQIRKEENQQRVDATLETINNLQQADQAFTEAAINREKKKLQSGEIDQKTYDKKVGEIQEKAAKREKAYAIASTIINTAQAVSKSLTAAPFPFNVILAAATAALGIAQLAKIISTPTKQDSGSVGSVSGGGTGSSGGSSTGTAPNTSFTFEKSASSPATNVSKTYVLTKDVSTASQLDRATIANGTI